MSDVSEKDDSTVGQPNGSSHPHHRKRTVRNSKFEEEFDSDELDSDVARASELLGNLERITFSPLESDSEESSIDGTIPSQIGRYKIIRLVGAGGCGVVYHGVHELLSYEVAVKIPLPFRPTTQALRSIFLREAQAAAKLDHPHIVKTHEAGEDGQTPFIAYAYCSGPTLSNWLKENGPCDPELAVMIAVRLADAVEYSHSTGILHRDIKPANVLLFPCLAHDELALPFVPKLTDFGLATIVESSSRETHSSVIMGTPLYLAPETLHSPRKSVGRSADVFGLGTILYESLTGQSPFQGATVFEVLDKIRIGKIPKLRALNPDLPRDLEAICEKALAIQPDDRYASAADLRADLLQFLDHKKVSAKSVSLSKSFRRLASSSARIDEASAYIVLCHFAILVWVVGWPIKIFFKLGETHGVTLGELIPYSVPLIFLHAISVFFGRMIAFRKVWAVAISLAIATVLCVFQGLVLSGVISPPYPAIYSDDRSRDIVFSLLLCLFFMQAILCGFAWKALAWAGRR